MDKLDHDDDYDIENQIINLVDAVNEIVEWINKQEAHEN